MLAGMATKLHAARLVTHDAARRYDEGHRIDLEAGMAKLFASEAAYEIATDAMRIHGGYGYTTEYPVERYYRDAPPDDHRRGNQRDPEAGHRPVSCWPAGSRRTSALCPVRAVLLTPPRE